MENQTPNGAREGAVSQVAIAPELVGAPRKRGPSAFAALWARPEVRVWAAPLLRGLTLVFGLSSVAVLGHAADVAGRYGVPLSEAAGRAPVSLVSPSSNAQASGVTPAPAPAASSSSTQTPGVGAPEKFSGKNACPVPPPCSTPPQGARPSAVLADGRVVLNEASVEDLMRLPGVGQKRAEAMLALRDKLGGFKKVSDLTRVKGIGYKSIKKFEGLAVVTRPREDPSTTPVSATGGRSASTAPPVSPPAH